MMNLFKIKMPHDCVVDLDVHAKDGAVRPKLYFQVTVLSKELNLPIVRYVLARDCALVPFVRVRLWLALLECRRMVRKAKAFKANQGI